MAGPLTIPPLWREGRLGLEAASLLRSRVFRGEGIEDAGDQPVLLIPGFLAGDDSLGLMTRWLRRTGHRTRKAGMRWNVGCSGDTIDCLGERLEVMAETRGRRVAIIGQSRGGSFAKVLAVRYPEFVSGIVTLGSPQLDPFAVHPLVRLQVIGLGALGSLGVPGLFTRRCRNGSCCEKFWEDMQRPVSDDVGYLSIYSRSDGVVNWRACLDPCADHLEVNSSHIGMAVSPPVYEAVAAALARFRDVDRRRSGGARRAPRLREAA